MALPMKFSTGFHLLVYNAVLSVKVNRRFGGTRVNSYRQRTSQTLTPDSRWLLDSFILSTLKLEAKCSSETFGDFQRITRRYIPEDRTVHRDRCENL
jgi:hypothetical protein